MVSIFSASLLCCEILQGTFRADWLKKRILKYVVERHFIVFHRIYLHSQNSLYNILLKKSKFRKRFGLRCSRKCELISNNITAVIRARSIRNIKGWYLCGELNNPANWLGASRKKREEWRRTHSSANHRQDSIQSNISNMPTNYNRRYNTRSIHSAKIRHCQYRGQK